MDCIIRKHLCSAWKLAIILIGFITPNFTTAQTNIVNNCYAVVAQRNNYFYEGIDNPISLIGVFGDYSTIVVSSKTGIVESLDSGKYIVRSLTRGYDTITVSEKTTSGTRIIYEEKFSVKPLPQPIATLTGRSTGGTSKAAILASPRIVVCLINIDVEKAFDVLGFRLMILNDTSRRSVPLESSNEYLTDDMKMVVSSAYIGDRILIYDILVRMSENENRIISPIVLRIDL